jgi:hypothetical protein
VERALLPAQRIFFAEFGHGVAISSKKQGGVLQRRGYILSKRCNKEVYFDLLNSPEYRAEVFELVWPPLSACVGWRVRRALRALLRHAQEAGSEAGDARVSVVGSLAHLVSSVGCRVTVGVTGGGGGHCLGAALVDPRIRWLHLGFTTYPCSIGMSSRRSMRSGSPPSIRD